MLFAANKFQETINHVDLRKYLHVMTWFILSRQLKNLQAFNEGKLKRFLSINDR